MLKGIHLTLMVGPAVPVPVPRMVLDALTSVEVTNTTSGPSGFSLSFTLTNNSPLQTIFLLAGGAMPPMIRVVLVATINGVPEVLIDGVMTQHEVEPGSNGYSTLKIMGEDLTRVMDYQRLSGIPYPAMPSAARVAVILAKYLALGVLPIIVPRSCRTRKARWTRFLCIRARTCAICECWRATSAMCSTSNPDLSL